MRSPALHLLTGASLLALTSLLGGCGGDITHAPAPEPAPPPLSEAVPPADPAPGEPVLNRPEAPGAFTLTPTADKSLRFSWTSAAGASEYRLFEDADGASGDALVATLPASATRFDRAVLWPTRLHARYRLQACNAAGCSEAAPITLPEGLARAVDFLKAANPGAGDRLGSQVALSADGQTLAVGAPGEGGAGDALPGSGAVYMFQRTEGVWRQQAYLKAAYPDSGDQFGAALALSADGLTLAVGAPTEDGAAAGVGGLESNNGRLNSGAAYVFTRSGSEWRQQAYVKALVSDNNDQFGYALALSGDGRTLAVGAPAEDSSAGGVAGAPSDNGLSDSGAVLVYVLGDTGWRYQAFLKAGLPDKDHRFGIALALSSDGGTLAVGAPFDSSAASGVDGDQANKGSLNSGAVHLFAREGPTWQQQAYLKASNNGRGDLFGGALALSGDGRLLAVGALYEDSAARGTGGDQNDEGARDSGAVYLFAHDGGGGGAWRQQAYLKASNTDPVDLFGSQLALSADGTLLAVGAPLEASAASGLDADQADNSGSASGAVYLFARGGAGWQQRAYLKGPQSETGDQYGLALALSADGGVLAVGVRNESSAASGVNAPDADSGSVRSGAAYVY